MNTLAIALLALLAVATAAPADNTSPIPVVAYSFDGPNPDGSYSYSYETGNGIKAEERGQLRKLNDKEDAISVEGAYSYTAADGSPISLTYVADENGFQPKGEHLPTPPPIPAGILRALEYIAAHPEQDDQSK